MAPIFRKKIAEATREIVICVFESPYCDEFKIGFFRTFFADSSGGEGTKNQVFSGNSTKKVRFWTRIAQNLMGGANFGSDFSKKNADKAVFFRVPDRSSMRQKACIFSYTARQGRFFAAIAPQYTDFIFFGFFAAFSAIWDYPI